MFSQIILAALVAACGAAKLDRTYLPPASAKTAGGSPGALQAPNTFSQNTAPKGSYTNDFQGVVVDAALAGMYETATISIDCESLIIDAFLTIDIFTN